MEDYSNLSLKSIPKRTCRIIFRTATILGICTLIVLCSSILHEIIHLDVSSGLMNSDDSQQGIIQPIIESLKSLIALANQILYNVAIVIPLKIDSIETVILSALKDMHTGSMSNANCTPGNLLLHDAAYINGINKFLALESYNGTPKYGPLLNIPSFIPSATSPHGCTRIPSFSLIKTHWCYTHNVILGDCLDFTASNQYLSMGIIQQSAAGFPIFRTMKTIYLSDGINRKSCSVTAIPGGCVLYCYVATRSEKEDYATTDLAELRLAFYYYNDTFIERVISLPNTTGQWATINPAVGSGIYHLGFILFPVYGGLINGTTSYNEQSSRYFIPKHPNITCAGNSSTQAAIARSSYVIRYHSNRLIQSAVLICPLSDMHTEECNLVMFNNSQVMMGAEGRLYVIGNNLYYYQRSSSWWSASLFYRINTDFSKGIPPIIEAQWVPSYQVPRPGVMPCNATSFCPANCITGVYADVWPLNNPEIMSRNALNPNYRFAGAFLKNESNRTNPTFYTASANSLLNTTGFNNTNHKAAYTSSTCFKNTGTQKIYCLIIIEMGSSLLGEFQILPFLRELML